MDGTTFDALITHLAATRLTRLTALRLLAEHLGVRADEINREPYRAPTLGEQIRETLTE